MLPEDLRVAVFTHLFFFRACCDDIRDLFPESDHTLLFKSCQVLCLHNSELITKNVANKYARH
jgi:hypothetical protein